MQQPQSASINTIKISIILTLVIGISLPLIDTTIVSVAVPTLKNEFNSGLSSIQWVVTVYTLAAACMVPMSAWLTKRLGAKQMWIAGLSVFTASSILCGLANNTMFLIVFRLLQGIGAGILTPVMQTVLVEAVGKENLKKAMASVAAPAVIAPIVGPLLAGVILEYSNWRVLFFINVPIGIVAIAMATKYIEKTLLDRSPPFDLVGYAMLVSGLLLIIYGLSLFSSGNNYNSYISTKPVLVVICGFILIIAFYYYGKRKKLNSILLVDLFRINSFMSANALLFISSIIFYGGLLAMPLIFSYQFGYSTGNISLLLGLHGLGALLSRFYTTKIVALFSLHKVGFWAAIVVGITTCPLLFSGYTYEQTLIAIAVLLRGGGLGILTILAMSHTYSEVPRSHVADASSISRVCTLLGGSLGTCLVAVMQASGIICIIILLIIGAMLCCWPVKALK